jgi:ABC-type antimicrobial peptide transport system permease subunit
MIFKIIQVILLASVKYFLTLPYAMLIGLDYGQAVISVLIGGIGGFLFFYYLSHKVIIVFHYLKPRVCKMMPETVKIRFHSFCDRYASKEPAKVFSRKSRMIARIKATYGFWGIIIATPFLLSIPVGAFIMSRYYTHRRHIVPFMILSIISWTAVLTGVVHIFPRVFF